MYYSLHCYYFFSCSFLSIYLYSPFIITLLYLLSFIIIYSNFTFPSYPFYSFFYSLFFIIHLHCYYSLFYLYSLPFNSIFITFNSSCLLFYCYPFSLFAWLIVRSGNNMEWESNNRYWLIKLIWDYRFIMY